MTPRSEKEGGRGSPDQKIHFGFREVSETEKKRLVQGHFDTIAARYDSTNTIMNLGRQHRWKKAAMDMLDLQPGQRVLDICGCSGGSASTGSVTAC